jgi:hypothetical protein
MSASWEPDELDELLRQAMQARPEVPRIPMLAERSMRRAAALSRGSSPIQISILKTCRRWNLVSSAAAAILITFVVGIGAWSLRHTISSFNSSTSDTQDVSSTSSAAPGPALDGAILLISATVILILAKALSQDAYSVCSWRPSRQAW